MPDEIETPFMDANVRKKIVDDENLHQDHKSGVLHACMGKEDEEAVKSAFKGYAEGNRLVGLAQLDCEDDQYLGHIKTLESVARYLSQKLRDEAGENSGFEEHRIAEHLRSMSLPEKSLPRREATAWFEEEVFSRFPYYVVSGRPSWVFEGQDGDARKLLSSEDCSSLPCRLGLPDPMLWGDPPYSYPRGIEFVGFAFKGANLVSVRRPTALDGDYDSVKKIWKPGGRTEPLPHGPEEMLSKGGLDEAVCEPVHLSEGIENVYLFEN